MSDGPALRFLVAAARALAHEDGLKGAIGGLLESASEQLGIASAAAFAVTGPTPGSLEMVASTNFGEPAIAALAAAARNPEHPIAQTVATGSPAYDVRPTAPGGPALRSHLPLTVTRAGRHAVVGVLAVAHDHPTDAAARSILEAAANLAAVAIERARTE